MKTHFITMSCTGRGCSFHTKGWLFYCLAIIFVFMGCQKELEVTDLQLLESPESSKAEKMRDMRTGGAVVTDWYNLQTNMILNANPQPSPVATGRLFSYEGIALYEAVRHGIPKAVGLTNILYQMPEIPAKENSGYSWSLVANATMAHMTRNMFPNLTTENLDAIDALEEKHNTNSKPNVNSEVSRRSREYGQAVAMAIIEWSKSDGSSRNSEAYTPPVFAGAWVPTPPAFAPAALPYMGSYRPLLEMHLNGELPAFPHPYSEVPGSPFYNEVYFTYQASKNATAAQKDLAVYWHDTGVGKGYTTPGHHIRILTAILEDTHSDLGSAAIAYAKTGIASRDAFIQTWRYKYQYNLIRPVTYVQKLIEPNWLPNISATPNHPEYPAAHAVVTSAFMEVMAGLFGENFAFEDRTYTFLGWAPHQFSSFREAAREAGWSRIYGGIHYVPSVEEGLILGQYIGQNVNALNFHP